MDIDKLTSEELIELVRSTNDNPAFEELAKRMSSFIRTVASGFFIVGMEQEDVYQEALIAFYKATRKYKSGMARFDVWIRYAIRGHLITLLERSQNNKTKYLNRSLSLDYDSNSEDDCMSEKLVESNDSILDILAQKEYYQVLFGRLYWSLSDQEKEVFLLRAQKRTYQDIAKRLNRKHKSIKNAMCSILSKARKAILEHEKEYV